MKFQLEHQLTSKNVGSSATDDPIDPFEVYTTVKALYYLSTNPSEINETKFSKIKEILLDYSNAVRDNKLQTFINTYIKKEFFSKSREIFSEEEKLILLESSCIIKSIKRSFISVFFALIY